jgi:hypothetical protein
VPDIDFALVRRPAPIVPTVMAFREVVHVAAGEVDFGRPLG